MTARRIRPITVLLLAASFAAGAGGERPSFGKLRYDEDWSFLRDASKAGEPLDDLKFIAVGESGDSWLSLGGEARWHYDYTDDPAWGDDPRDPDGVFLQRYALHGDLHLGSRVRLFGQLYGALESGRAGDAAPIDENRFDLQQAFADIASGSDGRSPVLRVGRQEMAYGSSRLVDVREGPNVRRTFQGVRLWMQAREWRIDAIAERRIRAGVGSFDDEANHDQALWGVSATHVDAARLPLGSTVDLYYRGHRNRAARFGQGAADELRHPAGARVSGERDGWDWNWELILQGGRFGDGDIAAWSLATDTGHTWPQARGKPRFGLSANIASGDRDPADPDLQSFNALYPRGNYFSEVALLGPRNFYNLHPGVSVQLREDLNLTADIDFFWRLETGDGVYGPGGNLLLSAQGNRARHVGTELSLNATWDISWQLALTVIHARFQPGRFIRETGSADDIDYLELTLKAMF